MKKTPKFKSAEEKRRYLENESSWNNLKARHAPKQITSKTSNKLVYSLQNPPGRERLDLPSRSTGGGSTACKQSLIYSGDVIIGIGLLHKSNYVPVIKDQEAKDLTNMRR